MPAEEGLDSKSLGEGRYFFVCFEYKPKHYKKIRSSPCWLLVNGIKQTASKAVVICSNGRYRY